MTRAAHHDGARVGKICVAALEAAVLHGIEVHVSVGSGLDHDDALVDGGADGGPAGGVVLDWAVSGVDPLYAKVVLQLD